MKLDKQDRRSQRTRQLVSSAMLELLSEKRYEAITVQDILDRAGIGRSTFYSHYFDKDDVHASMIEQMLERMNQQLSERHAGQGIVPSLELFQHIQQDHMHFQALASGQTGERLWETMQTALGRIIEEALESAGENTSPRSIPLTAVSSYLAGAFLNLLKWWLKSGMPYSPEEMDRIFQQLALPGVWATLERKGDETGRGHLPS
ncbi:MAG TPA: TetR/AcrR family transcriptional regulator [Anaerolineales bacterium]|nr:TetR/AcrR family transcriptional regulator [Anaerolineales bacterium]